MAIYLSNAFSLSMIAHLGHCDLDVTTNICNYQQMVEALKPISVVGHEDTANLFSNILCMDVPMNRVSVTLEKGDILIVGQYTGPRLPEGTSILPEGASINWMCVQVE
mgnify:FL=1